MPNLTPVLVTLVRERRPDGSNSVYPDFSSLNGDPRLGGLKVGEFVDSVGIGWYHDKVENLGTGHPNGRAIALVPVWLATEMQRLHPTRVSRITEAECEDFYNNRAMVNVPEMQRQDAELAALANERALREARGEDLRALDAEITKALDPDDPAPGIRRRPDKFFRNVKTRRGLTIV